MGVFDKAKDVFNKFVDVTDTEYGDGLSEEYAPEQEPEIYAEEPRTAKPRRFERTDNAGRRDNVVQFDQSGAGMNGTQRAFGDSQVVVKKVVSVNEVGVVIDILKQRRIVFLNLEDAPADAVQRIIDVIYGATYALEGSFRSIAERAFVLTPHNVSVSCEDYSAAGEQTDR